MKKRAQRLIPRYAILPLLALPAANLLVYFGTKPVTRALTHYSLALPIDGALPFVPAFITVYILAYLQWVICAVAVARDSRELCREVLTASLIAKLLCLVPFILLPTAMERPTPEGADVFSRLTRLVFELDTPVNLFPSIHCIESWLCLRGALKLRRAGRGFAAENCVFTAAVFVSVLLVKQHVAADVIGGVAFAEAGLLLARRSRLGLRLETLSERLFGED